MIHDPSIILYGIYPKESKTYAYTQKQMQIFVFLAAFFIVTKMSFCKWMDE